MIKEDKLLLELIRKSQFNSNISLAIENVDFDVLFDRSIRQAVLGLVASELADENIDNQWTKAKYQNRAAYIKYCHAQDELKNILDVSNIPFVVLKGNASAIYYLNPSFRTMGDIDVLVTPDLYDKAKKVLADSNYTICNENERHADFHKDGISIEIHRRYCFEIDFEEKIIKGLGNREFVSVEGFSFPILPKLENGLVLLDHFRFHLKSSVGLRHVIDWMMYSYHNLNDDFWYGSFQPIVKSLGLEILAITLTRSCQLYLGLPETITWCKDADSNTCDQLVELVLKSGNFGRMNNAQSRAVENVSVRIKRQGLFRSLQIAGEHNWALYNKYHLLKPFCWFYQIFRYAKQGITSGKSKKQLKSDLDRSIERYELLKKLGIE